MLDFFLVRQNHFIQFVLQTVARYPTIMSSMQTGHFHVKFYGFGSTKCQQQALINIQEFASSLSDDKQRFFFRRFHDETVRDQERDVLCRRPSINASLVCQVCLPQCACLKALKHTSNYFKNTAFSQVSGIWIRNI
jgi:hypothetical protein